MLWLLLVVGVVLSTELAVRLPLAATAQLLSDLGLRSGKVLAAKAGADHRKQQALLIYARMILYASLKLLALLLAALAPLLVLALVAEAAGWPLIALLSSAVGIAAACAAAMVYLWLRKHVGN